MSKTAKQVKLKWFKNVFNTFDLIGDTTKRTEKSALLRKLYESDSSDAARYLFWLAMGTPKFYVTSKQLTLKPKQVSGAFANTDTAVNFFIEILSRITSNKLSGNAAKGELNTFFSMCHASEQQKKTIHASVSRYLKAVLDKKLRLGVDTTVTELWTDIVDVFGVAKGKALIVQKTGKEDPSARKMISFPCDVEPKKDGYNISFKCNIPAKKAVALSSDNMELPALQFYADIVMKAVLRTPRPKKYENCVVIVIDGECESRYDLSKKSDTENWKSSWGKTSALVKSGLTKQGFDPKRVTNDTQRMIETDLLFSIYEAYPESAHSKKFECKRVVRRKYFTEIVGNVQDYLGRTPNTQAHQFTAITYVTVKNEKEMQAAHAANVKRGEEGSILRMPEVGVLADSKWRGNFVKYKVYGKEDAVILGVEEGNGRNAGRGGAFISYLIDRKAVTRVTIPSDAAKVWAWKNRDAVHGFFIEVVSAKDATGDSNASRNPVLARFRDDQQPMTLKEVQALCVKHKLPVPKKENIGVKLYSQAIAKIAN